MLVTMTWYTNGNISSSDSPRETIYVLRLVFSSKTLVVVLSIRSNVFFVDGLEASDGLFHVFQAPWLPHGLCREVHVAC